MTVKFALPIGSSPTLTAAGQTPLRIPSYGKRQDDDITIMVARSLLEAGPENIIFAADAGSGFGIPGPIGTGEGETFDQRLHDLDYEWDFGDTTSPSTFSAPVNLPAEHNTTNRALGPVVAHTFPPGTYTITCTITNPANLAQTVATTEVTVLNPDVVFPGTQTLFVGSNSSDPARPAGSAYYATFDAAAAVYLAASTPIRIVLQRGETHNYTPWGSGTGTRQSLCLSAASGAGSRPVLKPFTGTAGSFIFDADWDPSKTKQITANGVDLINFWDATGSGSAPGDSNWDNLGYFDNRFIQCNNNTPKHVGMYDCKIAGWQSGFVFQEDSSNGSTWVANFSTIDCVFTDWLDFPIFHTGPGNVQLGGGLVMAGCRAVQNVNATTGRGKGDPDNNEHGPIRVVGGYDCSIHQNEFFSNTGWSETGANVPATITVQPCVRLNTGGDWRSRSFLFQNMMEGANTSFSAGAATNAVVTCLMNGVAKYNIMLCGHQANSPCNVEYGGWTLENNLGIRAAGVVERDLPLRFDAFLKVASPKASVGPGALAGRIVARNNTMVMLSADSREQVFVTAKPEWTNVQEADNLLHCPNTSSPITTYAPLASSNFTNADAATILARYLGYADPETPTTIYANTLHPTDSFKIWEPDTESSALGAATGDPYRNVLGEVRTGSPNIGAV